MRGATVVRPVLAIMLMVAVFSGIGTVRTDRVATALPDWRPYIDAGKTVALALTTIDYRTVDRDVQHILDNATGVFYEDFKSRSAAFTQVVLDAKSTSTSTITESRMDSDDANQAQVFVALTTTTINEGQPSPPPRDWRLLITVQKVGETYKASNVEFLR
jgi:Tfp pilus assembly protein FimT